VFNSIQEKKRNIKTFIKKQTELDTLRFITCGSVDDGKSTLIGRMLYESKMIFSDQLTSLKNDSIRTESNDIDIDFSLLMDGLSAEREQGITIDVAYRFFSSNLRKFIVADTPGHEQYTKNMVTGASTSKLAIILIDAEKGILPQTMRHSFICSLLGIKNIILAINKMDLVGYKSEIFYDIESKYKKVIKNLNFNQVVSIPLSALKGDNLTSISNNMKWYIGPTLFSYLETVKINDDKNNIFRFSVQWVNRPNSKFRGYSGTINSGQLKKGDKIIALPSHEKAIVKDIILYKTSFLKANTGSSVTILLDREIDISRGDILISGKQKLLNSDQFETKIIWMDKIPGYIGRTYLIKIANKTMGAQITNIKYKININTFAHESSSELNQNDISVITISIDKSIPFENFDSCPSLGSFILIDKITNNTIAAGMINFSLRRANNIHTQNLDITKKSRQRLNAHKSKVLWFTGLSGSGKSSIANALEKELYKKGIRTYILDGDNIRKGLNKDLGFSNADRVENIRRIAEMSKILVDSGIVVLSAFISPFRAEREMARLLFKKGEFIEIFVNASLETVESRDPKGLYKKARKGEIPNFTGLDSPYEDPLNPEIILDTNSKTIEENIEYLMNKLDFSFIDIK
jgi:bifunctional enzyme CysN/CysC